jgi:CRISPR-associated protein Csx14
VKRLAPLGYADPAPKKSQGRKRRGKQAASDEGDHATGDGELHLIETFPAPEADCRALPLRFERNGYVLDVSHWCDESSRKPFKLFAGQQRSAAIAQQMLAGVKWLWNECRGDLTNDPLGLTVPLGGSSFKFDARKAWTTIDAGYSPDEQKHAVAASPVVEILAAIGLEHARPDEFEPGKVRYGAWKGLLPPALARPVLGGARVGVPMRIFRFTFHFAGKNKVVTFAEEETYP